MATVTTSFATTTSLESAATALNDSLDLESALILATAAYDYVNYFDVSFYSAATPAYVAGTLTNGDTFAAYGSNLLGYPYTITQLNYNFVADGISVSEYGAVSEASEFSDQTGYVNKVEVSSATYGKVTILGYDNVALYGDGTVSSVTWARGGATMTMTGSLSAYVFVGTDDYYYASISGTYTAATLSYASQTIQLSGISVDANADFTTANDFLALTLTGNDQINGTSGAELLNGYAGNDTLAGGLGSDTLIGGTGNDTFIIEGNDTITENANEGTDLVQAAISYTLGANLENLTLSGSTHVDGTGNGLANSITGNAGNNRLDGAAGADSLTGGAGNDTYIVDDGGDLVTEGSSAGADEVQSSVTYTLTANLENLTLTGSANLSGTGNTLANIIVGNSGDNLLTGGLGADSLDGGQGLDTATYAGAKSGYALVKVGAGYTVTDTNTADGDEGTDTLSGIEWLQFSDGATKLGRVLADTSGDGKSDLMWRNTDGSTSLWLMNGTSVQTYGSFGQIPTAWQIAASGDLNGDGKTDLMWRHSDGSTSLWLMNGTTVQSYGAFGQIPTPWQITTTGDFNGDGKTDLMWRHTDGSTSLWLMNGTVAQGYGSFGAIPTAWQITASGDFDGDGKTDLMWRHTDGSTSLWLMNGTVAQGFGSFGAIPVTWSILDSQGDYNGDGKNDLLWRNIDGSTNLWLMNGTTVQTYGSFGQVATGWNLVDGHGDYNGDGKSDLMWRHTDGSTSLWLMNGTVVQTYGSLGAVSTALTVADAHGDYNGDGKSDILWRNSSTGEAVMWLMNGASVSAVTSLGVLGTGWSPVVGADAGATLSGDAGGNTLMGTLNSDTLIGLAGNDTLTGGAGADRFVFNTTLNATTNVDTLTDFSSGTDKILLDHLILTALTTGNLATTSFVAEAGAIAHDGNDYILYDTTTGNLAYDADGTGAQAAVLFATLSGHPTMVAADLAVV
jgi:Ca2+-binding RTX toxin-like protein